MKIYSSTLKIGRLSALLALGLSAIAGAVEHPVSVLGRVYVDTNCNGCIDAADVLVNGVGVALQKSTGPVLGIAQTGEFGQTGVYAFPSDLAPVTPMTSNQYTLTLMLPMGYSPSNAVPGPFSTKVTKTMLSFNLPDSVVGTSSSYDFLICRSGGFITYTQGGWGSKPHGNNPGMFLSQNFASVYGTGGVMIGGGYNLKFTSAKAVEDFLPQGSTPRPLTASAIDPKNKNLTVLAGQVLSVQLAVDFSDTGVTTAFLGDQVILSGPLAGMTVRDALSLANAVLGGNLGALPVGLTISGLNDVMTRINENYDGGSDRHYLGW